MKSELTGRVAVVTGGGRGIGRAISLELARRGATVWINYSRSEGDAASCAQEIITAGGAAEIMQFDVGAGDSTESGIKAIAEK